MSLLFLTIATLASGDEFSPWLPPGLCTEAPWSADSRSQILLDRTEGVEGRRYLIGEDTYIMLVAGEDTYWMHAPEGCLVAGGKWLSELLYMSVDGAKLAGWRSGKTRAYNALFYEAENGWKGVSHWGGYLEGVPETRTMWMTVVGRDPNIIGWIFRYAIRATEADMSACDGAQPVPLVWVNKIEVERVAPPWRTVRVHLFSRVDTLRIDTRRVTPCNVGGTGHQTLYRVTIPPGRSIYEFPLECAGPWAEIGHYFPWGRMWNYINAEE